MFRTRAWVLALGLMMLGCAHAPTAGAAGPPPKPVLIEPKGKVLFEEPFKDLKSWRHEGGHKLLLDQDEPGTLRLECIGSGQGKRGTQAFCLRDFPDGIAV